MCLDCDPNLYTLYTYIHCTYTGCNCNIIFIHVCMHHFRHEIRKTCISVANALIHGQKNSSVTKKRIIKYSPSLSSVFAFFVRKTRNFHADFGTKTISQTTDIYINRFFQLNEWQ